jgi:formate dehydrogenase iron-sulfur subunit
MKGILIDVSKCIGCGACREACRVQNNLPETDDKELSSRTFTVLKTAGELNYRRLCMHCLDPTCASVCPVGAFRKTAAGPVIYAAERCMGCRYCMVACPFGVPRYEWDKPLPLVRKCTMCSDRVLAGGVTACSEACPTAATLFGDRDTLIKEARARIAAEPAKYVDRIYGVEEAGGTSVLYISPVTFEKLGLPDSVGKEPLPLLTYAVLSKIPHFVAFGSVFLGGVWWITNRRAEVARAEKEEQRNGGRKQAEGKGARS